MPRNGIPHHFQLLILLILALFCFGADILTGSVAIPVKDVLSIIFANDHSNIAWTLIVEKIRIPKAITAVLAGSALSVSGLQMQTLFRNPLAGPSELGITAGAALGVAVIMLGGASSGIFAIRELGISGSWLVILMASSGSAGVLTIILFISRRVRDNVILLIVGIMVGAITLSIVSIWQYFSAPEQLQEYIMWTFGSLGGVSGEQLYVLVLIVFIGLILAFASSKSLNALLLGENYARTMGLSVKKSRLMILLSTSILTGSITAFCGPIGFIGIAVPHLARAILKSSDHKILIPGCCFLAVSLMLICDILSQSAGETSVLPINVITSLIGAPVVIWVIVRLQRLKQS